MRYLAATLLLLALAGCGQTGRLYLPDEPPPAPPQQVPADTAEPENNG